MVKIKVMVHPNSRSSRTEELPDGIINIYVREPATEGRANRTVVEKLSEIYKVPKSSIILKHGEKSKTKIFEINN